MSPDILPILERIRERAKGGAEWQLSCDEVAAILDIDRTELYRRAYAASLGRRPLVDLSAVTGSFGPESTGELLAVLELFYGGEAERVLAEAGAHFPHEHRVALQQTLLELAGRTFGAHVVDEAVFSAMLRTFGRFDRACDAYLAELGSVETLIPEAVERYCSRNSFKFPELARATADRALRLLFRRKVLTLEQAASPLLYRLRAQAVREGYVKEKPRPSGTEENAVGAATRERERAQGVLELAGRRLTPELLRSQYRRLMKRFHPDMNPTGLERCKEINAAYALLAAAMGA